MNWDKVDWELRGTSVADFDMADVCQEKEDSYFVFPEMRSFGDVFSFCSSVGAQMAAPASVEEMDKLKNATGPFIHDMV